MARIMSAGSTTTLNGNLRLVSDNAEIAAGATFSGPGRLVIAENSHVTPDHNAEIDVLLDNQGRLRVGGLFSVGRNDVQDYQQSATGEIFFDIEGSGLNQFDRLFVDGGAQLAGALDIRVESPFVPAIGQLYNIISAPGGITGAFSAVDVDMNAPGLALRVNYLPTLVQLEVVDTLPGDYNGNGIVDAADYTVWRDTLGASVASFAGADGDGSAVVNQLDYDLWKSRFGDTNGAGAAAAVPEPTTIFILAGLLVAVAAGRRHPAICVR